MSLHTIFQELHKVAADMDAADRAKVKAKNFAIAASDSHTGEPAYPIHDISHARAAIAMVKAHGTEQEQREVYTDVARKYPALASRSDVEELREKVAAYIKETRRAWRVAHTRKGKASMGIETLLRKEKDGSLGGYKLATLIDFNDRVTYEDNSKVPRIRRRSYDLPSPDDESTAATRQDSRDARSTMPMIPVEIGADARSTSGAY
jgi:hypothetical protein